MTKATHDTSTVWDNMKGIEAFDLLSTAVFVAGPDGAVCYANKAFYDMFRPYELEIRKDIPQYDLDAFIGTPLVAYHPYLPPHAHIRIDQPEQVQSILILGKRHYGFKAMPIRRPDGTPCGLIAEWTDETRSVEALQEADRFIETVSQMSDAQQAGDISHFADPAVFSETYSGVINKVNAMVRTHIEIEKEIVGCAASFAAGNFDAEMPRLPGDLVFINDAMEAIRRNFRNLEGDVDRLARALVMGEFDISVDSTRHQGTFRNMMARAEIGRAHV